MPNMSLQKNPMPTQDAAARSQNFSEVALGYDVDAALLEKLEALVRDGLDSIDVVCPGFAADCLETIEEIDDELRRAFRAICPDGRFRYIPALNASDAAIDAYETILRETLAGW